MGACPSNFVHTAILNLAINAHNAMPHGGTHETRRPGNTREERSDGETHAVETALMMLIVGAPRPLFTRAPSPIAKSAMRRGDVEDAPGESEHIAARMDQGSMLRLQ